MKNNAQTFSGLELDRAVALRKDARWVSDWLRDRSSRFVAASAAAVLLDVERPALVRYPLQRATDIELEVGTAIVLGMEQDSALFAVDLEAVSPTTTTDLTGGARVAGLRDAGAVLRERDPRLLVHQLQRFLRAATTAAALLNSLSAQFGHVRPTRCRTVVGDGAVRRKRESQPLRCRIARIA